MGGQQSDARDDAGRKHTGGGHGHSGGDRHAHGHGPQGHSHGVSPEADRRWLSMALALITGFMAIEVVIGVAANSLALISDAAHMLTDAAAIVLALIAMRLAARPAKGGYTYGLKRAEILSAQANGLSLLLLAVWLTYESVERLIDPPEVAGSLVVYTALAGIVVNIAAAWCLSRANRASLNIEGAFQHVLNDLAAFVASAIAGLIVVLTGFARADALATLVVVALMVKAGYGLMRDSGRILLEAAPADLAPDAIGAGLAAVPSVAEVHDLHVWTITSGQPALSAHVLVSPGSDCHTIRATMESLLRTEYAITHTTLQVDHVPPDRIELSAAPTLREPAHCGPAHGRTHTA